MVNRWDHPRVCGEKAGNVRDSVSNAGSPPRMRGKESDETIMRFAPGITPAYAGKSSGGIIGLLEDRDHPRVCGEKPFVAEVWPFGVGITPAYAGKSPEKKNLEAYKRDHPRVCGEKPFPARPAQMHRGSPPRMRGKAEALHRRKKESGITPAYAGKRLKRSHSIGHFSCILCLFHSVLHRASVSGGSRAGPCAPPCLPAQNAVPV